MTYTNLFYFYPKERMLIPSTYKALKQQALADDNVLSAM